MTSSVLKQLDKTGPYRIPANRLVFINAEADDLGFPIRIISPEKTVSTAEWLQQMGQALQFPAHFGNNFDALYDCLCDREIMPQAACVLILNRSEALDEEACDTLIAVLQAVADEWREQQRHFWALFNAEKLALDLLPLK